MISDPRAVSTATVFVRDSLVATISRAGDRLLIAPSQGEARIGYNLDLPAPIESAGLPPFFTNLLPEGRRLAALQRRVKTSPDDDLSLLLAAGRDPIGDVCVVPEGEIPWTTHAVFNPRHPKEADFADLFRRALDADIGDTALPGVQGKLSVSMISFPDLLPRRRAGRPGVVYPQTEPCR